MPHRVARAVGDYGEQVACAHLTDAGLEVLERNWRCDQGELDIVARDGDTLVFCEVKTRRSDRFGSPLEAVTRAKAAGCAGSRCAGCGSTASRPAPCGSM